MKFTKIIAFSNIILYDMSNTIVKSYEGNSSGANPFQRELVVGENQYIFAYEVQFWSILNEPTMVKLRR
jgi:hypothetical protein